MRISEIEVVGTDSSLASKLKFETEKRLAGKYFFLFPQNNAILYPNDEIEFSILSQFAQVDAVQLSLKSLKKLEIKTEMRKPSALWCRAKDARPCYYIDKGGLIFEEASEFSPGVYFIYYGNVEGNPIGSTYLSDEKFKMIESFKAGVRNLSLIPSSVSPLSEDSFKLSVSGGDIIFSLRDDISATLSNLASVLADSRLSVMEDQTLTISSIDLRFGNKVILKKGAE